MVVQKNKVYKTKIEDLAADGQGIGKVEGFALFAEGVIPGDTAEIKIIKANKSHAYGKLVRITEPSVHRVEPGCAFFETCGGCALLCMDYAAQLAHKTKTVAACLERIGGFENAAGTVREIIGMGDPYHYRNKAQFPVKKNALRKSADIGFYSKRSHDITNIDNCAVLHGANDGILHIFKNFLDKNMDKFPPYDEMGHTGLIRHIFTRVGFSSGEIMVCIVTNGDDLPKGRELRGLIDELSEIGGMAGIVQNVNKNKTNVILGDKTRALWGRPYITDYIGDKKFKISANSFYQVNPVQTKKLYDIIVEYAGLDGDMVCADAYCGIGTIALMLAPYAKKVYGVEIVAQAVADAAENAKINGIPNATFLTGKSEEVIPELISGGEIIDLVVLDPPRKGCDARLLESLVGARIPKLVYVSCDPATLARDLKLLTETAYALVSVQPVDMFPHTMHTESVALLALR